MADMASSASRAVSKGYTPQDSLSQNQTRICDDGNGGLVVNGLKIDGASVDYSNGQIRIPKSAFSGKVYAPNFNSYALQDGGVSFQAATKGAETEVVEVIAPREASLSYVTAPDTRSISEEVQNGSITFDILQGIAKPRAAILNSWVFDIGGVRTVERSGVLYQNWDYTKGAGDVVGNLNGATGMVTLNQISANAVPTVKVLQGVYTQGDYAIQQFNGHTAVAPVKPQSFTAYVDGNEQMVFQAGADGKFEIKDKVKLEIDYKTGFYTIDSKTPIPPDALRYNAVAQSVIPLNSTDLGINAVRLPIDGRVPIFRRGDMVVIHNTITQDLGSAHSANQQITLNRQNLDRVCVVDADGKHVNAELYDYDMDAGTLTWTSPLDLSPYKQPLTAHLVWEEENRITDTNAVTGDMKLQFGISRDYPLEQTYVSSAVIGGDLLVRNTEPFSQKAWTNVWQDTRVGDPLLAQLNTKDFPIELASNGAITERWLIKFSSPTQFELYGEHLGMVAEGDTLTDFAPTNPATQKPYFKIPQMAFGGGWERQNCIRFNTQGTPFPVWVLRAIQPSGNRKSQRDGFGLLLRGNTNVIE